MKALIFIMSLFFSTVVFSGDFEDLSRSSDGDPPKCEEPEIPQAFIDKSVALINEHPTDDYQTLDFLQKLDEQEAFAVIGELPFDQMMRVFVIKIKRAYDARLYQLNATPQNKAIFINLMNAYKNLDKPTIESEKGIEEFGATTQQFVKAFGAEYYYTEIHGWGYNAGAMWEYGDGAIFEDDQKAARLCNCVQFGSCRCRPGNCGPSNGCFPSKCTGRCGWR